MYFKNEVEALEDLAFSISFFVPLFKNFLGTLGDFYGYLWIVGFFKNVDFMRFLACKLIYSC